MSISELIARLPTNVFLVLRTEESEDSGGDSFLSAVLMKERPCDDPDVLHGVSAGLEDHAGLERMTVMMLEGFLAKAKR